MIAAADLPTLLSTWVFPTLAGGIVGFVIGVIFGMSRRAKGANVPDHADRDDPGAPPRSAAAPEPAPRAAADSQASDQPEHTHSEYEDEHGRAMAPVVAMTNPDSNSDDMPVFAMVDPASAPVPGTGTGRMTMVVTVLALGALIWGAVQQAQASAVSRCQSQYNAAIAAAIQERAGASGASDAAIVADRAANRDLWLAFLAIDQNLPKPERDKLGKDALNRWVDSTREADKRQAEADAIRHANPLPAAPDCG